MNLPPRMLFSSLALTTALSAQCPPPTSVVPPTLVPVSAGQWGIQHFGQPLAPGQLDYILISLPAPTPIPFSALPWLFCNTVGNTPCLYADLNGVTWFDLGPSPGQNVTVNVNWPNNPVFVGTLLIAQFGTAGCATPAPDLSVIVTVQLN